MRYSKTNSEVYFILDRNANAVKVGVSNDPDQRLEQLQTGSAYGLELLGTIPGNEIEEARIHAYLSKWRLKGEWFAFQDHARDLIELLLVEKKEKTNEPWTYKLRPKWDNANQYPITCPVCGSTKITLKQFEIDRNSDSNSISQNKNFTGVICMMFDCGDKPWPASHKFGVNFLAGVDQTLSLVEIVWD